MRKGLSLFCFLFTVISLGVMQLYGRPSPESDSSEQLGTSFPQKEPPLRIASISLDYTLATDYVWRGINLSEYPGEGREKLKHQVGFGLSLDTDLGSVGGRIWSEWYMGQEELVEQSHNKLQEIDYTV